MRFNLTLIGILILVVCFFMLAHTGSELYNSHEIKLNDTELSIYIDNITINTTHFFNYTIQEYGQNRLENIINIMAASSGALIVEFVKAGTEFGYKNPDYDYESKWLLFQNLIFLWMFFVGMIVFGIIAIIIMALIEFIKDLKYNGGRIK